MAGMIFAVLLESGAAEAQSHHQKNQAGDLEPELVQRVTKRAPRGANSAPYRIDGTAAPGLLPGDSRHQAYFAPSRNFAHALDFNSLQRYNDATLGC